MRQILTFIFLGIVFITCQQKRDADYTTWQVYGGNAASMRYSSLSQINKTNVKNLQVAWQYSAQEPDTSNRSQIQCNPIIVDGILYGSTPQKKIFALDAATGKEIWKFDPKNYITDDTPWWGGTTRGITYWQEGEDKRLLVTAGPFLFSLDIKTGKPIENFGEKGKIDLHNDLDRQGVEMAFVAANTPGIIYKNLIIIGMRVSENADAAPGHIRAYDVKTGKRAWIFHTIPQPGEFGYDGWEDKEAYQKIGGANCWAGMALDEKRGIVYVPTGSAAYDFYGAFRKGDNLFANCLLALDANTGKRIWHYQTVHHDLWDKDLPAPPTLVSITKEGRKVDAIAQITKTGLVFLLDRQTGVPIFPIEEKPVPQSDMPDEKPSRTQPIPDLPEPFTRQFFAEKDLNTFSEDKDSLLKIFRKVKTGGPFIPPSLQGSVFFPGFDGGGEWGGSAFDPTTEMLYVNANEMPWLLQMVAVDNQMQKNENMFVAGKRLYESTCASCHGKNREGGSQGIFPTLINLKAKYSQAQVANILNKGKRMMPSFKHLSEQNRTAILTYVLELDTKMKGKEYTSEAENKPVMPYTTTGYNRFVDGKGYPAIAPPWGTLNAINLQTGKLAWQAPLGAFEELTKKGIPVTGTENYGGMAVTAGGLVFIGASKDEKFRVFDKDSGKLLYETKLPAGGYATPAVYEVNGKQFVVIACGGGKMGTKSGDSYVAFSLK
ncbi:MAG: PQQ-binding-like beta-propeller repeat protein [Verrucomicrobia bacterium]|nr:PQQ-binding-like beta-propeller repeat protein [Cytophagales bacterium]